MTFASVPAFAATVAGWFGARALFNTLLTKLLDRRTERLKDERSAGEREKDRQHEVKKREHEAQEREKDRQHEARKWKHDAQEREKDRRQEQALALLKAREGSPMALAAA